MLAPLLEDLGELRAARPLDLGKAPNTSKIGHKDDGGERARRYKGKTLKGKVTTTPAGGTTASSPSSHHRR